MLVALNTKESSHFLLLMLREELLPPLLLNVRQQIGRRLVWRSSWAGRRELHCKCVAKLQLQLPCSALIRR